MTLSITALLILIPGLCYALAALVYGFKGQWAMMIVYSGYAWANVGLMWIDQTLRN